MSRRFSRSRLVYGATTLLVLAGLLLAACRPAATPTPAPTPGAGATPSPTPTPKIVPTGELRMAVSDLGRELLDPAKVVNNDIPNLILLYDWLVEVDEEGNLAPERSLAEKWEIAPDGKSITFYIRQGVKFHNGDELTPEDVKFSLERALGPTSAATWKTMLDAIIDTIRVEAPNKVIVTMAQPDPLFLFFISPRTGTEAAIVPKKYLEANGDAYFGEHPVGTGPYKLNSQSLGSYIRYEALDYHWAIGVPRFKYVTMMKVPEEGTRLAMLKTGEADLVSVSTTTVAEVKNAGFDVATKRASLAAKYVFHHVDKADNPTGDSRVRKALSLAINRKEIANFLFVGSAAESPDCYCNSGNVGYDRNLLKPTEYNVAQAKQLLAEAGYPEGKGLPTLTFYARVQANLPEVKAMAETVAGYWAAIGVKSSIQIVEAAPLHKAIMDNTTPYPAVHNWTPSNRPKETGISLFAPDSTWQSMRIFEPGYKAKYEQVLASATLQEYERAYQEIMKYMVDNTSVIGIVEVDETFGTNPKIGKWPTGFNNFEPGLEYLVERRS